MATESKTIASSLRHYRGTAVADLLGLVQRFEMSTGLEVSLVLASDGSGSVAQHWEYPEGEAQRFVYSFDSPEELADWLEGKAQ